jgi:Leucine-rich repeat (LRR) protein
LNCYKNQLTSLDVSGNTSLNSLFCYENQIRILDLTNNIALEYLMCEDNQLTSLDLRNGNNTNMYSPLSNHTFFGARNNPSLTCINVDDAAWSTANWTVDGYKIDSQHYFSNNCPPPSAIQEHTSNKKLIKVIDLLGRETKDTKNKVLFYIYDDGTVEKGIVIE